MLKKFLGLFFLRGVKILLSVATMLVLARIVGVSDGMDIWVLAFSYVTGAGMITWGPLNEMLRSKYIRLNNNTTENTSREYFNGLIGASVILNFLIIFIFSILYFFKIDILGSAVQTQYKAVLVFVIFVMSPTLILSQYTSISTCLINCHDVLYAPELIGIIGGVLNILIVYLYYHQYGIYSLVAGYYASLFLSAAYGLIFYWRNNFFNQIKIFNFNMKHFQYFFKGVPILMVAYFLGQFNSLYEKSVANNMGVGFVSLVNYASQIKGTLQAVFASVIITLIVPTLSKINFREHSEIFYKNFSQGQSIVLLFLLMLIPAITSSSSALTTLIFSEKIELDTKFTIFSNLLEFYTVCLFPIGLYLIFSFGLISQGKEKIYAAISIATQIVSIVITYSFSSFIQAAIFPASLFVSHTIAALSMLYFIEINDKMLIVRKFLIYGLITLLISFFILFVKHVLLMLYSWSPFVDVAISMMLGLVFGFVMIIFDEEIKASFLSRIFSKFI